MLCLPWKTDRGAHARASCFLLLLLLILLENVTVTNFPAKIVLLEGVSVTFRSCWPLQLSRQARVFIRLSQHIFILCTNTKTKHILLSTFKQDAAQLQQLRLQETKLCGAPDNAAAAPLSSSIEQQLKTLKVLKACLQGKSSQSKKVSFEDKQNRSKNSISAVNSQDQDKSKQSKKVSFDLTNDELQEELPLRNDTPILKSCLKVKKALFCVFSHFINLCKYSNLFCCLSFLLSIPRSSYSKVT